MDTVYVVTPSVSNTTGIVTLTNELTNDPRWSGNIITYPANDDPTQLANAAITAYNAAKANPPAVLVAAGTLAAKMLQDLTPTIPIIQAVGGAVPDNPKKQTNITGFLIYSKDTAQYHLDNLTSPVAILWDNTNNPSNPSYYTYNHLDPKGKKIISIPATTLYDLQHLDPTKLTGANGFMVIPNAIYYNNCGVIAAYVDGKTKADGVTPLPIYYPEDDYKRKHTKTAAGVMVHGHDVSLTYRLVARYVISILNNSAKIDKLKFKEAVIYVDDT